MRNFRKVLALALVFAIVFTFTASAASFTDTASIGVDYVDDVNMLVELGVLSGYPDGSFGPQKNITRAEFAKMAYTLKYGSDADGNLFAAQASKFTDVEGNANVAWAKGYINYCANQNIVSGVGANKFNPQGNITVAEAAKMILVILGCDPAKEGFTGANWMSNVVSKAIDLGVFDGWAGDPSALATRELVSKLMRNAVFAPIYTYSAITGAGGQVNALGTAYNKTLGETTMGLYHISGIVVANEKNALEKNEKGERISVSATSDEEEAIVYYVVKSEDGTEYPQFLTIDRGLSDEYLGNKVDVYFKADVARDATTGVITAYYNPEVIGNVLINSDTVVYEVAAHEADIYPDADYSKSTSTMYPYIGFTANGAEQKIALSHTKVAKNVDAQTNPDVIAEINNFAYVLSDDASLTNDGTFSLADDDAFTAELGKATLSQYRFVSVDGGKTFGFMFKFADDDYAGEDEPVNVVYGTVVSKNASSLRINGDHPATIDLEDVVADGDIAIEDYVVAYRANGKVNVSKIDYMKAAFGAIGDEGTTVVLNGKEYFPWVNCDIEERADLFDFYQNVTGAKSSSTKYYIYNNMIMEIEIGDSTDEVDEGTYQYAVITRSSYDATLEEAFVNLTFADGKSGAYKIGKLYKATGAGASYKSDYAEDFTRNKYFGAVVKARILDDGTVDLSAQNFKSNEFIENYGDGTEIYGEYDNGEFNVLGEKIYEFGIYGGQVKVSKEINGSLDEKLYYTKNDDTVIFLIYGNPMYKISNGNLIQETDEDDYVAIGARAYTISDLTDFNADYIRDYYINSYGETGIQDILAGHVLFDSTTSRTKSVVAASMTVGKSVPKVKFNTTDDFAYIVSATQQYKSSVGYYAILELIGDDGYKKIETTAGPVDTINTGMLTTEKVGAIDGPRDDFPAGSFIRYKTNADGKITTADSEGLRLRDIVKGYNGEDDGLFLVNIIGERGGNVSFYDTIYPIDTEIDPLTESTDSLKFHEDEGCQVITISEDDYVGEKIQTVHKLETELKANTGNAILQVYEGRIIRIFSFAEGYEYKG